MVLPSRHETIHQGDDKVSVVGRLQQMQHFADTYNEVRVQADGSRICVAAPPTRFRSPDERPVLKARFEARGAIS